MTAAAWRASTARRPLAVGGAVLAYAGLVVVLWVNHRQVALASSAAGLPFAWRTYLDTLMFSLSWVGFPAVGALLAVRRPQNPIGWWLLAIPVSLQGLGVAVDVTALLLERGARPPTALLVWVGVVNALKFLPVLAVAHVLLLFPDGELDRLGRRCSRWAVGVFVVLTAVRLVRPGPIDGLAEVRNPLALGAVPEGEGLVVPLSAALFGIVALAAVRLALRYRRAGTVERKQFQWILASIAVLPVFFLVGNGLEGSNYWLGQFTGLSGFVVTGVGFTLALHRAVTRHDLFGIDRLVSRTLTYLALSVLLGGAYLGLVVGLGAAATAATGGSGDLVVALSTLAVAAAFQPLRRRVSGAVDRRFNRARYDAAITVDAFGRDLRDEVSLDRVAARLASVAATTLRPTRAGVVLLAPRPGASR